jgi:hypothetical protein
MQRPAFRSHRPWLLGIVLTSLVVVGTSAPVSAAVPGWTGPSVIATGSDFEVRLGVDGDGWLHLVTLDDDGLLYRTNEGGTWRTTRLWEEERSYQDDIDVRVDRGGNVYIAWARGCGCDDLHYVGIWYLTNAFGGPNDGWPSTPTVLVNGNASEPSLRLVDYKVHLAWVQGRRIWYGTNATGTWTQAAVSPKGVGAWAPSLAVAPAKTARIAYESSGIVYAVNTGTSAAPSFRRETIADGCDSAAATHPSLALDSRKRPHVAWACTTPIAAAAAPGPGAARPDGTYYALRTASGWSQAAKLSQLDAWPQLVLDGNGRYHIFDGQNVISNASGSVVAQKVTPGGQVHLWTAWLALTVEGKGRLVYDAARNLKLMKEQ